MFKCTIELRVIQLFQFQYTDMLLSFVIEKRWKQLLNSAHLRTHSMNRYQQKFIHAENYFPPENESVEQ